MFRNCALCTAVKDLAILLGPATKPSLLSTISYAKVPGIDYRNQVHLDCRSGSWSWNCLLQVGHSFHAVHLALPPEVHYRRQALKHLPHQQNAEHNQGDCSSQLHPQTFPVHVVLGSVMIHETFSARTLLCRGKRVQERCVGNVLHSQLPYLFTYLFEVELFLEEEGGPPLGCVRLC